MWTKYTYIHTERIKKTKIILGCMQLDIKIQLTKDENQKNIQGKPRTK